jgi:hypothetical protein
LIDLPKKAYLPVDRVFWGCLDESSASKNSLLQVTVWNSSRDGDEGGIVAKGLMNLNRELKNLGPSLIDFTSLDKK